MLKLCLKYNSQGLIGRLVIQSDTLNEVVFPDWRLSALNMTLYQD